MVIQSMVQEKMTDTEIICRFMSPKPDMPEGEGVFDRAFMGHYLNQWWLLTTTGYEAGDEPIIFPRALDLDLLWEVEERLTGDQWFEYENFLVTDLDLGLMEVIKAHIHADAPTRIKALAAVLRPIVEKREG